LSTPGKLVKFYVFTQIKNNQNISLFIVIIGVLVRALRRVRKRSARTILLNNNNYHN